MLKDKDILFDNRRKNGEFTCNSFFHYSSTSSIPALHIFSTLSYMYFGLIYNIFKVYWSMNVQANTIETGNICNSEARLKTRW